MNESRIDSTNNNVAISIIIPVYNEEKTIDNCLKSIYKQSLKNFEVLCCDDGSIDGTLDILHTYEKMYSNIKIFRQENLGAGSARNLCIKQAAGEFICFMDADDYYIESDALEALYNATKQRGLDVGCAFMQENNEYGEIQYKPLLRDLVEKTPKIVSFKEYQNDSFFQCYIFRKKLIEDNDITFPLYRRFQDPIFLAQCLHKAKRFVVVPVEFYFHRRNDKKITYDRLKANDMAKALKWQLEFAIEHNYSDLKKKMENRLNGLYGDLLIQSMGPDNYELLKILIEINDLLDDEHFVLKTLKYFVMESKNDDYETRRVNYIFRGKLRNGNRVLLYGAGALGKKIMPALSKIKEIEVKGWVDKNKNGETWWGYPIIAPDMIEKVEYDYILIAIKNVNVVEEVQNELISGGVSKNKIICLQEESKWV